MSSVEYFNDKSGAMPLKSLLFLFLVLLSYSGFSSDLKFPAGMHPQQQIDFVKSKIAEQEQPYYDAYLQLIVYADLALMNENHALSDFDVPGFYQEPQMHRQNSLALQSDAFDAYACALAYRLGGEEKYAHKAREFLMAWASINKRYSNYDGSLVMAYSGTGLVIAAQLLSFDAGWTENDRERLMSWVQEVYRKACNEIRERKNNWADWGRFGSILSAALLEDQAEVDENIRLMKSDLFDKIAAGGHMPEEVRREANGIWYTYFSLAPITAASWVAYQVTGTDLFRYEEEGRSMKSALDYLLYYSQHPDEWKWFENPRTGDLGTWPYNLLEAMEGIYGEERYTSFLKEARPLIYPKHHFAWTFPTLMKPYLNE